MSKFEVQGIQSLKFYLSYRSYVRDVSILWTMYGPTLLKMYKFFIVSLKTKNMLLGQFVGSLGPNLNIIVIIM